MNVIDTQIFFKTVLNMTNLTYTSMSEHKDDTTLTYFEIILTHRYFANIYYEDKIRNFEIEYFI